MKYAHIHAPTGRLLGWYSDDVHGVKTIDPDGTVTIDRSKIPTPRVEVSDEDWQDALQNKHNFYDSAAKTFGTKDFRTPAEKAGENAKIAKAAGDTYTLDGTDYVVPFTSADATGLLQVRAAFDFGVTETAMEFSNGVKMPLTPADFATFAPWFVARRNAFFTA